MTEVLNQPETSPSHEGTIPEAPEISEADWQKALAILETDGPKMLRLFGRHRHGPQAAEDLLQETAIRIAQNIGNFELTERGYTPWVMTIARNLSFDVLKRQRKRDNAMPSYDLGDLAESIAGIAAPHDPIADSSREMDAIDALKKVQEKIHPALFEAVMACSGYGVSYQEYADTHGLNLGTVRSRVFRGKAAVRAVLTNNHGLLSQINGEKYIPALTQEENHA